MSIYAPKLKPQVQHSHKKKGVKNHDFDIFIFPQKKETRRASLFDKFFRTWINHGIFEFSVGIQSYVNHKLFEPSFGIQRLSRS